MNLLKNTKRFLGYSVVSFCLFNGMSQSVQAAEYKTFKNPRISGRYVHTCKATSSNPDICSQSALKEIANKLCRKYGYDKAVSQSSRRKDSNTPVSKLINGSWRSHRSDSQEVFSSVRCKNK